jgi:L-aminopeptidase/D-esterase-like protein
MPSAALLSIRDVPGIRVGHATDEVGRTGCTVLLADGGAVAGVDVRGSAPGTRETELLRPTALVERIHALCLGGGSAFGLAAADGVMRYLAERGIGFDTGTRPVPIVPAAILFDLFEGSATAFPGPDDGYAACAAGEHGDGPLEGRVGAGTGATVGKLAGPQFTSPGGVGSAALRLPDGSTVGALAITNAVGNVIGRDGHVLAGVRDESGGFRDASALLLAGPPPGRVPPSGANTTLAVVATDALLDRAQCSRLAAQAQDALALAIAPVHTVLDGDTVFALSTGRASAPEGLGGLLSLGAAAVEALRTAIERSVAVG